MNLGNGKSFNLCFIRIPLGQNAPESTDVLIAGFNLCFIRIPLGLTIAGQKKLADA